MKASVLTIGDEILRGRTVDSNFSFIAKKLFNIGMELGHHRVVGDRKEEIVQSLIELSRQSDLIFVTGGLGPTPDDITRFAIAEFLGSQLEFDRDEYIKMKKRFEKRNIDMPPSNKVQVMFPANIKTLFNPVGMAPGMYFEKAGVRFWILPGVPSEMKPMMDEIIAQLDRGEHSDKIILRTTGIPESTLFDKIKDIVKSNNDVIGYYPTLNGVDIVIRGEQADDIAGNILPQVDGFLYSNIEEQTLEQVIQEQMTSRGYSLSVAESCTGGMIASAIVDNPGSSDYFLGGIVSYSNEAKIRLLNVPSRLIIENGAASAEVARAMAVGVKECMESDYAIATTGIAGPTGGTAEKAVGLVYVALATPDTVYCRRYNFNNTRDVNRARAKTAGLFMLWLELNHKLDTIDFLDGSIEV